MIIENLKLFGKISVIRNDEIIWQDMIFEDEIDSIKITIVHELRYGLIIKKVEVNFPNKSDKSNYL